MNSTGAIQSEFSQLQRWALAVGIAALVVCIVGAFHTPTQFFRSYLLAFVFWVGVTLGCSAILMLHHLVPGRWGFVIRRFLESGARTTWLMALLIIPILFGIKLLYSWADPNKVRTDPQLAHKLFYLNVPFFVTRTVIYFIVWVLIAHYLVKWSLEQDRTANKDLMRRLQSLSAPGLLLYGLTVTYASVDWVMSLEPHWFSTIYSMIFMVTQGLSAMALVTILAILLADRKPLSDVLSPQVMNDLGNLLLTFTMLWAYLSFSQFLIIWSGNLQDEIPWYVSRASGGWAGIALILIVFHFAVPFFLLLMRFLKRRRVYLAAIAIELLIMSVVDMFWLTVPAYERAGPQFQWMDGLALIGMGGIWLWLFLSDLRGKPLLPLHDPRLDLEGAAHHG